MTRRTGSRKAGRRQRRTRRQRGGALGIVNINLSSWLNKEVKEAINSNTVWATIPFGTDTWPKMSSETLEETMTAIGDTPADTPADQFNVANYISVVEVDSIASESERRAVKTGLEYNNLLKKYTGDSEYDPRLQNIVNIENTLRNALNDAENFKDITTATITETATTTETKPLLLWFFINGGKGVPKIAYSTEKPKSSPTPPPTGGLVPPAQTTG
jgi:hypothetical protein